MSIRKIFHSLRLFFLRPARTLLYRLTVLLLIHSLILPPHLFAAETTSAPKANPNEAPMGDCQKACGEYKSATPEQKLNSSCGLAPTPDQSPIPISNNGTTYKTYADCKAAIYGPGDEVDKAARWGVLGQHCDAIELYNTGKSMDMIGAVAYTAAAVICTAACVADNIPPLALYAKELDLACSVTGVAATGADIYGDIKVNEKGEEGSEAWNDWYERKSGYAGTALGATGAAVAVAGSITSQVAKNTAMKSDEAKKAGEAAKNSSGKSGAAAKAAGKEAAEEVAKDMSRVKFTEANELTGKGASKGAQTAGKQAKAAKALTCISAAFFLATAGIKWKNYTANGDLAKQECKAVSKMAGVGTASLILAPGPTATTPFQAGSSTFNEAMQAAGGSTTGDPTDYTSHVNDNAETFPEGAITPNAATSAASLLDSMPNRNMIPDMLKKLGTSMSDIAKELPKTNPSDFVSSAIPDLPAEFSKMMKDQDDMINSGKFSLMGETVGTYSSGGGGGGGKGDGAADPFTMMKKSGSQSAGAKELGFDKTKKTMTLPGDGDIWHTTFGGSIFQIVSMKLNVSRDKIVTLEWAHPLNRALSGLAPLDTSKSGSPPAAPANPMGGARP